MMRCVRARTVPYPALGAGLLLCAVALFGCSTETEEPSFHNPFDPVLGEGLPIPDSVRVMVGDNTVRLTWSLSAGDEADEFAVLRKRIDLISEEDEKLLERVTQREYTDTRVANGRVYAYRIAAGVNGQFGPRTDEIEARPGLFTLSLADGSDFTRQRTVSVGFGAENATAIRLSENPDAFTNPWRSTSGTLQWTLSTGDGEKTLYARFRLAEGSETLPVFDTIRLDTNAAIASFAFTPTAVFAPGDTLHLRMATGETSGQASVNAAEVFDNVPLFDDGTNGDADAGDGIYERTLVIPASAAVFEREVVGAFTDEAGNEATPATAQALLTVQRPPEPVVVYDPSFAEPPEDASVKLHWSKSPSESFGAYRVFRNTSAAVDSSSRLIETITASETVQFEDTDVVEGRTYSYRIYVQDSFGLQRGSNIVTASVANERPPAAVTLETPQAISTDRIALDWDRSEDQDFQAYRLYRNQTGAVGETDELRITITDVNTTSWDDTGLDENTTYFYRIYTVDDGGLTTRGNEVEAQTKNEAPTAVALSDPTAVSASRIALDWSESEELDFQAYRIYGNETGAVSEEDPLLAEITDIHQVYWDDSGLEENTEYFYRVFVVDQGGLTARSNEVSARTKNEPPDAVTLNAPSSVDSTAATLSWGESSAHDFAYYRLYRDEIATVTTGSALVVELDDPAFTSFRDTELTPGARYYYRVFVVDDAAEAESTGSNTVNLVTPENVEE